MSVPLRPRWKGGMVSLRLSRMLLEGIGRKCSKGSIANTPATETAALIKSLSNIQIYMKIWAGRHSTDAINVNNTGNTKQLVTAVTVAGIAWCSTHSAIRSTSIAVGRYREHHLFLSLFGTAEFLTSAWQCRCHLSSPVSVRRAWGRFRSSS